MTSEIKDTIEGEEVNKNIINEVQNKHVSYSQFTTWLNCKKS